MRTTNTTPLLTNPFFEYAESKLLSLAKSEALLIAEFTTCDELLKETRIALNSNIANINEEPTSQAEWVCAHENIIDAMDNKLMLLAYFLKISNYMPELIKRFGPEYSYSVSFSDERNQSFNVDLIYFSDEKNIMFEISKTINHSFGLIHDFRKQFTNETWRELSNNEKRDPFATKFLQGWLVEPHDMHSKIEVNFFDEYGVILAMFQPHEHIDRWFDRMLLQDKTVNNMFNKLSSCKFGNMLPGFTCPDLHNNPELTTLLRYEFLQNTDGAIPSQGFTFGSPQRHVKKFKPHLIR